MTTPIDANLDLMGHENWQAHVVEEVTGDAAKQLFPKSRMAERASDQYVGPDLARFGLEGIGDRPRRNMLEYHEISRGAVLLEMLDHLLRRWRATTVNKLRWIDCEHGCSLTAFDQRQSVIDRASRGTA